MSKPLYRVRRFRRIPDDCWRRAVSIAYGHYYEDLPSERPRHDGLEAMTAAWQEWAAGEGFRWWTFTASTYCRYAPVQLERWIAVVPGKSDNFHAVAMAGDRLLADPSAELATTHEQAARLYRQVQPRDVIEAHAFLPIDQREIEIPTRWRIGDPPNEKGPIE